MEYITTISSKGQITLPAKIRRDLHIRPGDRLKVVKRGDFVSIKPDTYKEEVAALRLRTLRHIASKGIRPLTDEELDQAIDAAAAEASVERYKRSLCS